MRAVPGDEEHVLQARHTGRLLDDGLADRLRDGQEQRLRRTGCECGQLRHQVGLLPVDDPRAGDLAAEFLERVDERRCEASGVDVAGVDHGRGAEPLLLAEEQRHGLALVQVVVGGAVVALDVVLAGVAGQVGGQRRGGVAGRDQNHPRIREQGRRLDGRRRARRADHADHAAVRNDRLRRAPAAGARAEVVVRLADVHVETVDRPVVLDGEAHDPHVRGGAARHVGDGQERPDLNRLPGGDPDRSQRLGFVGPGVVAARRHREQRHGGHHRRRDPEPEGGWGFVRRRRGHRSSRERRR